MEGGGRGIILHYENGETLEQIACGDQKLTDAEKGRKCFYLQVLDEINYEYF